MTFTQFRQAPLDGVPFEDKRRWLAMWEAARGTRAVPVWGQDFAFTDIERTDLPRIVLLALAPTIERSVYRFWGTRLREPYDADMTGRLVGDLNEPGLSACAAGQYELVAEARMPCFFVLRLHAYRVGERFEGMLRLPFAGTDGAITTVLSLQFSEKDGFAVRCLWETLGETTSRNIAV